MIVVAIYVTYEEANERQLDLLAAGIDASVEYGTTDDYGFGSGAAAYCLIVPYEEASRAVECLAPRIDATIESIAACPRCNSSDVKELQVSLLLDVCFLMIPGMIELIRSRASGVRYGCFQCGNRYRKKL